MPDPVHLLEEPLIYSRVLICFALGIPAVRISINVPEKPFLPYLNDGLHSFHPGTAIFYSIPFFRLYNSSARQQGIYLPGQSAPGDAGYSDQIDSGHNRFPHE